MGSFRWILLFMVPHAKVSDCLEVPNNAVCTLEGSQAVTAGISAIDMTFPFSLVSAICLPPKANDTTFLFSLGPARAILHHPDSQIRRPFSSP